MKNISNLFLLAGYTLIYAALAKPADWGQRPPPFLSNPWKAFFGDAYLVTAQTAQAQPQTPPLVPGTRVPKPGTVPGSIPGYPPLRPPVH